MSTHRLDIEIDEELYHVLCGLVEDGSYASLDEAVAKAIMQMDGMVKGDHEYEDWLRDEAGAASEQADLHPELLLTGDQVLAFLDEDKQHAPAA